MQLIKQKKITLAHTQLINRYDHNRDIAALSENNLEYESCKAEKTTRGFLPRGANTF